MGGGWQILIYQYYDNLSTSLLKIIDIDNYFCYSLMLQKTAWRNK